MQKVKIVDFDKFGNVVRFYATRNLELETWWGDDWNDVPYEHNAGEVYPSYFDLWFDVAFPTSYVVREPCDGHINSRWSKEDMLKGRVSMCVAVRPDDLGGSSYFYESYDSVVDSVAAVRFRMGDVVDIDDSSSWLPSDAHLFGIVENPYVLDK